jgi:transposase
MSILLKYSLGLDMAKDKIDACLVSLDTEQVIKVKAQRKFLNTATGFKELETWLKKQRQEAVALTILLEATGVYHEKLALHLFHKGYELRIVLPNKAKRYMQALGQNSKNDKADAKGLACMGAQQKLTCWQPLNSFYYELRQLTRHYQSLQQSKTVHQNQLHALPHSGCRSRQVVKQLEKMVALIAKQISQMRQAIQSHISTNEQLKQKISHLTAIKGIDVLTVATVLAETGGFALFDNIAQLVSYAGYDVVENQSGKRTGKTRISKKGNSRIRRILHMGALNVVRYEQKPFLDLYQRLYERSKVKMKAYVAVQKKLLVIMYVLWKKNEAYLAHETTAVKPEEIKTEKPKQKTAKCSPAEPLFQVGHTAPENTTANIKKITPTSRATQDEQPVSFELVALFQVVQT